MLNTVITSPLTMPQLLLCLAASVAFGILSAVVFQIKQTPKVSLTITLALLPLAMCMVVLMINGNLGVAVAVAGGFTLVRFRSVAGTGREISAIFTVMTLGVICGMGYIVIGVIFFALVSALVVGISCLGIENAQDKLLRITIPEDYDYSQLFDDIFSRYNVKYSLERIKTGNMGSLIDLTYKISMPQAQMPKEMLDEIRTRNANLSVMLMPYAEGSESL